MSAAKKKKGTKPPPAGDPEAGRTSPTKPDEMSEELIEFLTAIDEYKRANQRPFPSWSEVLEILKSLGYERP